MGITFKKSDRAETLQECGLDFCGTGTVFASSAVLFPDARSDYCE